MKFIELFAGIGGFRRGLERTGHECVFANEWLAKPASIYENNFKDKPDTRDVRHITADTLPNADLIVGGFPCATFSIAGKRTGLSLEDTRGTLFYEMFRLARDKGVPYILFENVKGLLNHANGRTFGTMLGVMDAMGYDAQWELLDSENFGVPQHRERVFVIGHLRGHPEPEVFPLSRTVTESPSHREEEQGQGQGVWPCDLHDDGRGFEEDRLDDACDTIIARRMNDSANTLLVAETSVREWRAQPILTPHRAKRQNGRRMKENGESAFTLTAQDRHGVLTDLGIRKLTPLECERLQGLPPNWTKWYADGSLVSDSERYERCGRTVTIPVIEAIGERLHNFK